MPDYRVTRHVSVPADVAYAVAADVGSYKEFLPMLLHSAVRGARKKSGPGEEFNAELIVGYEKLGIRESFVSHVKTDPVRRTVAATSSEGPMKALSTSWSIEEAPGGCNVTVTITYAFRNRLMQLAFGGLLDVTAPKLIAAFEQRAQAVAATA